MWDSIFQQRSSSTVSSIRDATFTKMAQKLFMAIAKNDRRSFHSLVQEKKSLLKEKTAESHSTALHLASKFGHTELASEIIKLCPDMVAAQNIRGETPLHEACCRGNADVVKLLLETNPLVASLLNWQNQSAFSLACSGGHLDVVIVMLDQGWLMDIEEDRADQTWLHETLSKGHTDVVRTIMEGWPKFASKVDKDGCSLLHHACINVQLEIVRMLLEKAPELAQQFNNQGYTPLHLAAMNGEATILLEFMTRASSSFKLLTEEGETIFHLAAKCSKYDAFISMAKFFKNTNLLHQPDRQGNTVLHIAVCTGCYSLAQYIINETKVDINHKNQEGQTALDLLNQARATPASDHIIIMLVKSGGKKGAEVSFVSSQVDSSSTQIMTPEILIDVLDQKFENTLVTGVDSVHQQLEEKSELELRKELQQHKYLSQRRRKELSELHRTRRNKQYQIYKEELQNARNTIVLVAILIASVTFTVGLNPPGGVYQQGELIGQSAVGRKLAFKIFVISNSIALFTSLGIVIVLVSIIPFQRKKLMKMMVISHKFMWVAISFMATAFASATYVILPHDHKTRWMLDSLLAISAGTMGVVFVFLVVQLVRHWLRKLKWKKEKGKKPKIVALDADIEMQPCRSMAEGKIQPQPVQFNNQEYLQSESTNSDVDSASSLGYHPY